MVKKVLIIGIILIVLFFSNVGCTSVSNLTYSEVAIENLNKNVVKFITDHKGSNGVYIFNNSEKEIYLFLNNKNIKQGDKAAFYEDVRIEEKGDTIAISFDEHYTSDYNNIVENKLIYRIRKNKDFEYIKVYKNGEETYIDVVGS
ncbi:MAG: hypothetical protein FH751_09930 [Firmicutes bacterium]|nr:hypothetical protein [Bacillota bacterium]